MSVSTWLDGARLRQRLAKFSSDLHSITFAATCGVIAYRLRELDKLSSCLPSWIAWQVQVSFADMQIASVYVCIYIYMYVCVYVALVIPCLQSVIVFSRRRSASMNEYTDL